jgi:hypothetical protein
MIAVAIHAHVIVVIPTSQRWSIFIKIAHNQACSPLAQGLRAHPESLDS